MNYVRLCPSNHYKMYAVVSDEGGCVLCKIDELEEVNAGLADDNESLSARYRELESWESAWAKAVTQILERERELEKNLALAYECNEKKLARIKELEKETDDLGRLVAARERAWAKRGERQTKRIGELLARVHELEGQLPLTEVVDPGELARLREENEKLHDQVKGFKDGNDTRSRPAGVCHE